MPVLSAKKIWVVLQQREGQLHRMSREAITAGQGLAAELGGNASAVLLGSGLAELSAEVGGFDLEAVMTADDARLGGYTPGAYVGALAPAIEAAAPDFVVFPHTYQTVDFVPRLAQRIGAAIVPEVIGFEAVDGEMIFTRPWCRCRLGHRREYRRRS